MKGGGKMKFMSISIYPVDKTAEVAAAADKVWANQPRESRPMINCALLCVPQFDVPPNSFVGVAISESDSAEKMAARIYPIMLAGATIHIVPLLEVPIGGGAKAEKKYGG
jgi:hypothetical protein